VRVFSNINNTSIKRAEDVTIIKTRDNKKVIIGRMIEIISERKKIIHIANPVTAIINNASAIILIVIFKNKNFF